MLLKKLQKGATLLITTIVLFVVTVVMAGMSALFYQYRKVQVNYNEAYQLKVDLKNNAYKTYEDFLNDTDELKTNVLALETPTDLYTFVTSDNQYTNNFYKTSETLITYQTVHDTLALNCTIVYEDLIYKLNFVNFQEVTE